MKKFILLFLFLIPLLLKAQDKFSPEDWYGNWKGTLEIISNGKYNSVPMELRIGKTEFTDKFSWVIVYGEGDKSQERNYELQERDRDKGLYDLDEKNGIVLEMTYVAGGFYSVFDVEGMLISAVYRLNEGKINFGIISADLKNPQGKYTTQEDSLSVNSYHMSVFQNSALTKTDK